VPVHNSGKTKGVIHRKSQKGLQKFLRFAQNSEDFPVLHILTDGRCFDNFKPFQEAQILFLCDLGSFG
jgi:hypothetical protein